jgi:membrane-associated protein
MAGVLHHLLDLVLHLDRHLAELVAQYPRQIYALLFTVIFAETGFVVTPFLPGDSLLFATGTLAAVDPTGTLNAPFVWAVLTAAAVLGNTLNYGIGRVVGPRAFSGRYRLLRTDYLLRTQEFFRRYGPLTIVLSRFVPIVRTCAPFVAGIGQMPAARFQAYNLMGGLAWTTVFIWGGYLFGNIPVVRAHFGLVTILIIVVSLLPVATAALRERRSRTG